MCIARQSSSLTQPWSPNAPVRVLSSASHCAISTSQRPMRPCSEPMDASSNTVVVYDDTISHVVLASTSALAGPPVKRWSVAANTGRGLRSGAFRNSYSLFKGGGPSSEPVCVTSSAHWLLMSAMEQWPAMQQWLTLFGDKTPTGRLCLLALTLTKDVRQ